LQEKLLNSLKRKSIRHPFFAYFWKYCEKIVNKYSPDVLLLFGSIVKNSYTQNSDFDLLIIENTNLSPERRFVKYASEDPKGIIQPFVYTLEEIHFHLNDLNPFFFEIIEEGIPIMQKDETIIMELKKKVITLKEKFHFKKVGNAWYKKG